MHFLERGLERGLIWLAQATPTQTTEQSYDPNDVTPGPIGFFATVFLFIAVGLIAMSLMRRSARVQERWAVREQLEREQAAADATEQDAAATTEREGKGEGEGDGDLRGEARADDTGPSAGAAEATGVDGSGGQPKPGTSERA